MNDLTKHAMEIAVDLYNLRNEGDLEITSTDLRKIMKFPQHGDPRIIYNEFEEILMKGTNMTGDFVPMSDDEIVSFINWMKNN